MAGQYIASRQVFPHLLRSAIAPKMKVRSRVIERFQRAMCPALLFGEYLLPWLSPLYLRLYLFLNFVGVFTYNRSYLEELSREPHMAGLKRDEVQ